MHGTTEPHTPCLPSQCCALNLVMQQGCLYMGCQLSRRCQTCVHADDAISNASFMGPGIAPVVPAQNKYTSAVQCTNHTAALLPQLRNPAMAPGTHIELTGANRA